jgi:hypothetical protein
MVRFDKGSAILQKVTLALMMSMSALVSISNIACKYIKYSFCKSFLVTYGTAHLYVVIEGSSEKFYKTIFKRKLMLFIVATFLQYLKTFFSFKSCSLM